MNATESILEHLLDAVLVVDRDGIILYSNAAASKLFSRPANELDGQPFGFPVVPKLAQEIEILKAGQILTVQMLASDIEWEGSAASLLSLRDISAQKETQNSLTRQKKLLEQSNEENAQYASLASHDLKEPIRKILIFSDRLLQSEAIIDNDRNLLNKIYSSATRMNSLIGGITQLSNITFISHDFGRTDLEEVVKEVVSDLELQIEDHQAHVSVSKLPVIDAIPDEMYQLFLNLISNALKYSRPEVQSEILIREAKAEEGFVCIECKDNGIGFSNELAQKLFQPFQRLHTKAYDGIGIGLTLCQKIINVHHGQITAEGVPGEGAIFRIKLPVQQKNFQKQ